MLNCQNCGKELEEGAKFCDSCGTPVPAMITCPNCGAQYAEGNAFCMECGTPLAKAQEVAEVPAEAEAPAEKVYETVFCTNCGSQTSTEFAFCQNCGASIVEDAADAVVPAAPVAVAEKKKLPKKAILFGAIGVAAVAVLAIVISLIAGAFGGGSKGGSENNYALYVKDMEVFFTDLKKDEPQQLTTRFVDNDYMDEQDLAYQQNALGYLNYMSEDGKYLFYADKVDGDSDGVNLYYKPVKDLDEDGIKIDSDVSRYTVDDAAKVVTYQKGEEGHLYQYDMKSEEKEKIASEVSSYRVSDDGKQVLYINTDNNLYLQVIGEDKEKLASDVFYFEHVTEDFTTVYYSKDDTLYKQVIGEDKEKIASDVYEVLKIYDSGEIYYVTSEDSEVALIDYVVDDMAEVDANMTEPVYPEYPEYPEYPSWWDYDTDEEYDAAWEEYEAAMVDYEEECARIDEEYWAAYDLYWAKDYRDTLRVDLESEVLSQSNYSLCYFDGEEDVVLTDAFVGDYYYSDYAFAADKPVITYTAYNQASFDKVKLSEIESLYEVSELVEAALFSSSERYIAVEGVATVVEQQKSATSFHINESGTEVYYIDDIPDDKDYGELYHIEIKGGNVGAPEVYDSDVYIGYSYFINDDEFLYFKDYKDDKAELFINQTSIDYDVYVYNVRTDEKMGGVAYFVDWNEEKDYGTLKMYKGKEAVKVADDVHDFEVAPDGRILYLYDYSLNHYKGELYQWQGKEPEKIDDDVVCIIPIIGIVGGGLYYGW